MFVNDLSGGIIYAGFKEDDADRRHKVLNSFIIKVGSSCGEGHITSVTLSKLVLIVSIDTVFFRNLKEKVGLSSISSESEVYDVAIEILELRCSRSSV